MFPIVLQHLQMPKEFLDNEQIILGELRLKENKKQVIKRKHTLSAVFYVILTTWSVVNVFVTKTILVRMTQFLIVAIVAILFTLSLYSIRMHLFQATRDAPTLSMTGFYSNERRMNVVLCSFTGLIVSYMFLFILGLVVNVTSFELGDVKEDKTSC